MGAPDAIIGIAENFRACTAPDKVNVAIGAYRDDGGSPWVLPSVRTAEERLIARGEKKEYAGIAGLPAFLEKAMRFAYGQHCGWLHAGRPARRRRSSSPPGASTGSGRSYAPPSASRAA